MSLEYESSELAKQGKFFYVALSMLLSRSNRSMIPEAIYFLNPEQIMKFSEVFGGTLMYVPTPAELSNELLGALSAYYRYACGYEWDDIKEKLQVDGRSFNAIKSRVEEWKDMMYNLGIDVSEKEHYVNTDNA